MKSVKRSFQFISVIAAAAVTAASAFAQFELLEQAKPEKLSQLQIEEIMGADSKKDILANGYLASKHVSCLFDAYGHRYSGGEYKNDLIRFRLRLPPSYAARPSANQKYPLVIWFHGGGECGDDNLRQLAHIQHILPLLTGENSREFFLLATQCPRRHSFWTTDRDNPLDIGDTPIAYTEEIFDELVSIYPIDLDKISVVGFCAGMFAVRQFMEDRPNTVAAAVAISYAMPKKFDDRPVTDAALWFFYVENDPVTKPDTIKAYVERVNKLGGNAKTTECKQETGDAHNSWRAAFVKYKAFEWLLEQSKSARLKSCIEVDRELNAQPIITAEDE
jgi:predicted peptidase